MSCFLHNLSRFLRFPQPENCLESYEFPCTIYPIFLVYCDPGLSRVYFMWSFFISVSLRLSVLTCLPSYLRFYIYHDFPPFSLFAGLVSCVIQNLCITFIRVSSSCTAVVIVKICMPSYLEFYMCSYIYLVSFSSRVYKFHEICHASVRFPCITSWLSWS